MRDFAEQLKTMDLAIRLIQRGLRLSITSSLTGIDQKKLRDVWRSIHNTQPTNGKLPESVLSFIDNKKSAGKISAFLNVYFKSKIEESIVDPVKIIQAQDFCKNVGIDVDINFAYYGVRDVINGFASFPRCSCCSARFIFDLGLGTRTQRCPFCKTSPIQ